MLIWEFCPEADDGQLVARQGTGVGLGEGRGVGVGEGRGAAVGLATGVVVPVGDGDGIVTVAVAVGVGVDGGEGLTTPACAARIASTLAPRPLYGVLKSALMVNDAG